MVADVFLRKTAPVPIQAAHRKGSSFPADQFGEVKIEPKSEIVAIGKAGALPSDGVAGDVVGVIGEEAHSLLIEDVSQTEPIAGKFSAIPPIR